ncbi:JAB domain-containing protein [Alkaliphilus sp. B6464]|uniref:JAB domain-containing protein n=1 Tax=Alkaliphilus sp. B6464 TaxID=2731219 RepID=UPI001BAA9FC9|nr:JAB domain-containing protein [Alkaliphilus sp. B6464]QUH21880.1 hypothetical protein HYG84_18255 [Alkaliphilus sp. B6464]
MLKYIDKIIGHESVKSIRNGETEKLFAYYLKKNSDQVGDYELIGSIQFGEGDKNRIFAESISYNAFKDAYKELNADAVAILHNHPKRLIAMKLSPSEDDIDCTFTFANFCVVHKMNFIDHIVVDYKNYFSFVENNLIEI